MANEQYVFLNKNQVPARSDWQQAVTAAGFDLVIDESLEPLCQSGYLPCRLLGTDTGVETYYHDAASLFDDAETVKELAGDRDYCIRFRWGGRAEEAACAMILSYALAHSFDGVVSYEGEPPHESLADLLRETKEMLAEVGGSKPSRAEPRPAPADKPRPSIFVPKAKLMHQGHGIVEILDVDSQGRVRYLAPRVDASIRETDVGDPAFRPLLSSFEVDPVLKMALTPPAKLLDREKRRKCSDAASKGSNPVLVAKAYAELVEANRRGDLWDPYEQRQLVAFRSALAEEVAFVLGITEDAIVEKLGGPSEGKKASTGTSEAQKASGLLSGVLTRLKRWF